MTFSSDACVTASGLSTRIGTRASMQRMAMSARALGTAVVIATSGLSARAFSSLSIAGSFNFSAAAARSCGLGSHTPIISAPGTARAQGAMP
jgi:hypothetical protein